MADKSIHSRGHQTLALLLRDLREGASLRQVDVADALGRPQSFVAKYESGERRLDLVELRTLAGLLGVSLGELVAEFERRAG